MSAPIIYSTHFKHSISATGNKETFIRCPRSKKPASARSQNCPSQSASCWNPFCATATAKKSHEANIKELANWKPTETRTAEIPFVVARIVLQDFTGVPLLVDLAAMRSAVAKLGKNPKIIEPLVPVDLVVDHSVQVDFAGAADSMAANLDLEFTRNRERYQFLKWGMQAFDTFKVVPPGIGIVHQVNLEYLAKGVCLA